MNNEVAPMSNMLSATHIDKEVRGTLLRTAALVVLGLGLLSVANIPLRDELENARIVSHVAAAALKADPNGGTAVDDAVLLALRHVEHRSFVGELSLHLAIALFVAAAIVLVVEIHSRRRLSEELSQNAARVKHEAAESQKRIETEMNTYQQLIGLNVFEALFRRKFPPAVVKGLESIFNSDVFKDNVCYVVRLFRYPGMSADRIVVRRVTSFRAWNVSPRPVNYPVRSSFLSASSVTCRTLKGEEITIPRHITVVIDGVEQPQAIRDKTVTHSVSIQPGKCVNILLSAEEHYGTTDHTEYVQMTLSSDILLRIENMLDGEIDVADPMFLHPDRDGFKADQHGDFRFEGAIVPGQAIQIEWRPVLV